MDFKSWYPGWLIQLQDEGEKEWWTGWWDVKLGTSELDRSILKTLFNVVIFEI